MPLKLISLNLISLSINLEVQERVFIFSIVVLFFLYFPLYFSGYFLLYKFSLLVMTDPSSNAKLAPSNLLLDLNLTTNLNLETTVHDDTNNVKFSHPDTLYELVIFEPLKQIIVSHAMFKVTSVLTLDHI